jgi:eukaryotic-like serine/threonine-protein kinase
MPDGPNPNPELTIFSAARRLPMGQRDAFLAQACAGDAALRRRVEDLLLASEEAGLFLQSPAATPPGAKGTIRLVLEPAERPGDQIGRYKLLQQIGEGGCGVVYMAEQEEPVRRRVALKVIKLGMDTKSVIARFEAERQALALMDHPNIAKVLDAGATDKGRPYFVMELVRGIKITDYCDQNNLSTKARLELFTKVCLAVQHAHQKGIIHRDIKPSNILVTMNDGVPVPKVIDFGIAKATQGKLTDHTLFTAFEQFIGTPAYMSPEQAEMSALDIDTRSDLYSLGVLLYELLTGKTPFDATELLRAGLDEMRRQIREKEPARPSTRLSTMLPADLTSVAAHRQSAAPKLVHLLRGDLDWIVMKCLEKDRTRRYDTANGLASDIQRHLHNEPVLAGPASAAYRFQKAFRRNKLAFATAGIVAAMLVLGVAVSTWQALRATRAEKRTAETLVQVAAERDAKERARQDAEAISTFLTKVFQSPDPARDGRTITVAETLDRAAKKLETTLTNQPDRLAKLQATLGSTYYALGLYPEAITLQEKVRDYDLAKSGLESADTLAAMNNLAVSYREVGREDEAIKMWEKALPLLRKVLGPENQETLEAMDNLAVSYADTRRLEDSIKMSEEALPLLRKALGPENQETLEAMINLALSYRHADHIDESVKMGEEVLTLARKVLGPEHPDTLTSMNNLALSYSDAGRQEEALKLREEVLRLDRKVIGPEHPSTLAAMNNLALSYSEAGRQNEALKLRLDVLTLRRKVQDPEHPDTLTAMNNLATSYFDVGRRDEALKLRREVLALRRKVLGPENPDTLATVHGLTASYFDAGRKDEALKLREETLPLLLKVLGPQHRYTIGGMNDLADSYFDAGRKDEALKLREDILKVNQEQLGLALKQDPKSQASAVAYYHLGLTLDALGRSDEAIKAWQEAVQIDTIKTHNAQYSLGKALVDHQRYAEALPILRATQKFYLDGTRGFEIAELLTLAESMAANGNSKPGAPGHESWTAWVATLRTWVAAHPDDTEKTRHLAIVCLWLGETNEYQVLCRKLVEQAADAKDPAAQERAAEVCLIEAQSNPALLKQAVATGRQALALSSPDESNRRWFQITAAMAALRDGAPAEAEPLLTEALRDPKDIPERRSLALAFRSMAYSQLGRTNEAQGGQIELEKQLTPAPARPALSQIVTKPDDMAVRLAYEQAKALLNTPPGQQP